MDNTLCGLLTNNNSNKQKDTKKAEMIIPPFLYLFVLIITNTGKQLKPSNTLLFSLRKTFQYIILVKSQEAET